MTFRSFTPGASSSTQVSTVNPGVALRTFRAGVNRMLEGGARVNIAMLGDSLGEGWTAGSQANFYYRMRDELFRQLGLTASQGYHRRGSPNDLNSPKFPFGLDDATMGFGHRTNVLGSGTTTGLLNANPCDGFTVNWRRGAAAIGDANVIIDAGAPTTLPGLLATVGGGLGYCGATQYFPLAAGAHSIKIDQSGASTTYVPGVYVHHNDANTICVWNGARAGWNTDHYGNGPSAGTGEWADLLGTLQPDLLISEIALNNYQGGGLDKVAAYRAGLLTMIANARAASIRHTGIPGARCDPSIVLMVPWQAVNMDRRIWLQFRQVIYDVAAIVGAWVFDWWNLTGSVDVDPLGLSNDGTHANGKGHRLVGTYLGRALLEVR